MTFSKTKENFDFNIDNTILPDNKITKYLGIYISNDLMWRTHIHNIKTRAAQRSYLILKSFYSDNIWTLLKAYTTYIRPILEYGSTIWNPYFDCDTIQIEEIQRYFTKRIRCRAKVPFTSYQDRLYKLNIRSLQYRRTEADLIMTYKIIHNLVDLPMKDFFTFNCSPYNTRKHNFDLTRPKPASEFERNFFSNRIIPLWNGLPSEIVNAKTLDTFKALLKKFALHSIKKFMFKSDQIT